MHVPKRLSRRGVNDATCFLSMVGSATNRHDMTAVWRWPMGAPQQNCMFDKVPAICTYVA